MSLSPSPTCAACPYYDEPDPAHEPRRPALGAGSSTAGSPRACPGRPGATSTPGCRTRSTIFRGPDVKEFFSSIARQQLRELPDREHEALDLLQRGRPHRRPTRSSSATTSTSTATSRASRGRTTSSLASDAVRRRDRPDAARTSPRSPARRRWRRSSARPARACATSASCASATPRSTARRSRSAASACPATSPTSCAARSRTARRSTTRSSGRARTSASSASAGATYLVNHVEGGFPQMNWQFASAADLRPGLHARSSQPAGSRPPINVRAASIPPTSVRACAPRSRSAGSAR